jgi:hypothetical protein
MMWKEIGKEEDVAWNGMVEEKNEAQLLTL